MSASFFNKYYNEKQLMFASAFAHGHGIFLFESCADDVDFQYQFGRRKHKNRGCEKTYSKFNNALNSLSFSCLHTR